MAIINKPKIMISFRGDGVTGGPNNSHKRIMESALKEKYDFVPLFIPDGHLGIFNLKAIKKMAADIKACNPDIVHFAGLEIVGWYGCLACKVAGMKNNIVAIHGSTSEAIAFNKNKIKKHIMQFMERYTLRNSKYAYGVSKYVSSWKKVGKYTKNYFGHIYNLPSSFCESEQKSFRDEAGFSEEDILVMTSGRIIVEKGFDILKDTILSRKWDSKVKFVVIGDGNYRKQMQAELEAAGLEDKVYFTGFRSDVCRILKSGDIFVMCSLHETLCMSVLEACMAKLPAVVSDVGGLPEIIENEKNGFLVSRGNAKEFAQRIEELVENKDMRIKMGNAGAEIVSEKFSEESILNKIDELYQIALRNVKNGK